MNKCRGHFNSTDTVQSVADAQRLLSTLNELRELVQQATEGVHSQGKQLVEVLSTVSSPASHRKESNGEQVCHPCLFDRKIVHCHFQYKCWQEIMHVKKLLNSVNKIIVCSSIIVPTCIHLSLRNFAICNSRNTIKTSNFWVSGNFTSPFDINYL